MLNDCGRSGRDLISCTVVARDWEKLKISTKKLRQNKRYMDINGTSMSKKNVSKLINSTL